MKLEGELVNGVFLRRLNRFEAIADIEGCERLIHVPNTGRLKELLVEGVEIRVRKFDNSRRKTAYGLLLVRKGSRWVSIDSANVPNKLIYEALSDKKLERFKDFSVIRREVTWGASRFDFCLDGENTEYFIEVKGVTLVNDGQAFFPDAPTERGVRHLEELAELKQRGKGAGIIFVIQRDDAEVIKPNDATDRAFGDALRHAAACGVELWAYRCRVTEHEIVLDREIPVIIHS